MSEKGSYLNLDKNAPYLCFIVKIIAAVEYYHILVKDKKFRFVFSSISNVLRRSTFQKVMIALDT